jgi:hypothetical protein
VSAAEVNVGSPTTGRPVSEVTTVSAENVLVSIDAQTGWKVMLL